MEANDLRPWQQFWRQYEGSRKYKNCLSISVRNGFMEDLLEFSMWHHALSERLRITQLQMREDSLFGFLSAVRAGKV
ncbi:hypothetical protein AVEN_147687-1, partial [Araneus ventricosus]